MVDHVTQLLAIGDVVTDEFIELLPTEAEVEHDHSRHPLLCMPYGTKIPFKDSIVVSGVGNAANAAVASSKLGLNTAFASDIGDDNIGKGILRSLHSHGISTEFIQVHEGQKSNYHYVLWYKADRTILIKHEQYRYRWPHIKAHQKPTWIYLSSIGESGGIIHTKLMDYLDEHTDIKLAFQPGTFQIRVGAKRLHRLYQRASIFAANKEEFQQILSSRSQDIKTLIAQMHKLGPKVTLLTDGPKGAYASNGEQIVFMPPYPDPAPPLDRTGAGDSYASTFTAAIAQGKTLSEALAWAGVNSMSVVQQVGAQAGLLDQVEIERWLKKAPTSYKPKMI